MANDYQQTAQNLSIAFSEVAFPVLAAAKAFTTSFPLEAKMNPALQRIIPFATSGPTVQTGNSVDYLTGDIATNMVAITHEHYSVSWGLPSEEIQFGAKLAWAAKLAAINFAKKLAQDIFALVTEANFGNAVVTRTSANFGADDITALHASLPVTDRSIVLATDYFSKVRPLSWYPPSFSAVTEHNDFSTAGASVRGFCCSPKAILISYAQPLLGPGGANVVAVSPLIVPGLGIEGQAAIYFIPQTRTLRGSFSVYMGAGIGDASALKILKAE